MNNFGFIKNWLYQAKRDYGFPVDIYIIKKSIVNPETGKKTVDRFKISVSKAIVLPGKLETLPGTQLIPKEFRYGGYYDVESRTMIVEKKNLPQDYIPDSDENYVFIKHVKYLIDKVGQLDHINGYVFNLKATKGQIHNEMIDCRLGNRLDIMQYVYTT